MLAAAAHKLQSVNYAKYHSTHVTDDLEMRTNVSDLQARKNVLPYLSNHGDGDMQSKALGFVEDSAFTICRQTPGNLESESLTDLSNIMRYQASLINKSEMEMDQNQSSIFDEDADVEFGFMMIADEMEKLQSNMKEIFTDNHG